MKLQCFPNPLRVRRPFYQLSNEKLPVNNSTPIGSPAQAQQPHNFRISKVDPWTDRSNGN